MRSRTNKRAVLAIAATASLLLGGCGAGGADNGHTTLTVLAAASLTESFDELGNRFHAKHPDVDVRFDYQGSSTLAEQIRQGRPADVFASADVDNMHKVTDIGATAGEPATFTTNRLVIAVPKGNPAAVRSLRDLERPDQQVVVCEPEVPCGSATQQVMRTAGVHPRPASEENDVKSVLRKVQAGEADAGLVYVSDARTAAEDVDIVEFPESRGALNEYPIATLDESENPGAARKFTEFVRGPEGKHVLSQHGFGNG